MWNRDKNGSSNFQAVQKALRRHASTKRAKILQGFFKTGKGEYGEGDLFIGVTVPKIRIVLRQFAALTLLDIRRLLASPIHEERLLGLLILVHQFKRGDADAQKKVVGAYIANLKYVNNWDLVDLSAHHILGVYLQNKNRAILNTLSRSKRIWDRRVAIIATLHFIKQGDFNDTLRLSARLLSDPEDLMHKAVGWMLREVGKKDLKTLEGFLKIHYKQMPRTMLRYAIERFPEARRQQYLTGTIRTCQKV